MWQGRETENLLYAAVIDESLDEKKLAQVTADMSNLLGADGNGNRADRCGDPGSGAV